MGKDRIRKNNSLMLLGLTGMLLFGAACREVPTESNQPAVNIAEDTNQTVVNTRLTKGSLLKNSPDAEKAPYDLQFLDTMIAHHQSAIVMANSVVAKSDNAALKNFAAKIIRNQNKEIAQMKIWREKWFAGEPAAVNAEMSGMTDAMKGMNMKKLEMAGSKQLDLRFLGMMTSHHEAALVMAKDALDKAGHTEIKTLASRIIKTQEAEIEQMKTWTDAWSK